MNESFAKEIRTMILIVVATVVSMFGFIAGLVEANRKGFCVYDRIYYYLPAHALACEIGKKRW